MSDASRFLCSSRQFSGVTSVFALAGPTLRFMDRVGNARYGVALPYNYLSRQQWLDMAGKLRLTIQQWTARLKLYPWWARWVFERKLHFIARMEIPAASAG